MTCQSCRLLGPGVGRGRENLSDECQRICQRSKHLDEECLSPFHYQAFSDRVSLTQQTGLKSELALLCARVCNFGHPVMTRSI